MFCRKCGSQIKDGVKFCVKCGSPVDQTDNSASKSKDRIKDVKGKRKSKVSKKIIGIACVLAVVLVAIIVWRVSPFFQQKYEGEIIFETEYDIEGYFQECFIVSKNDGMLYGVLDMEGEEIIPIKYDYITVGNYYEVMEGDDITAYLCAVYEDEYTLFNTKGKEIFSSEEYTIGTLYQECFVVSKNDGVLYGVLDIKGEEVIPVRYDSVYFLYTEIEGEGITPYFSAKYEDEYTVFDIEGNKIMQSDSYISQIVGEIETTEETYFKSISDGYRTIVTYDSQGDIVNNISLELSIQMDEEDIIQNFRWITEDCFVFELIDYSSDSSRGVWYAMVYANGEIQYLSEGVFGEEYVYEDEYIFEVCYDSGGETVKCYAIDAKGNLRSGGTELFTDSAEYYVDESGELVYSVEADGETDWGEVEFEEINRKLYESNGTWKLVDDEGEAVYDERYYSCFVMNYCYFLSNEDNELCMINSYGNKVIDYGWLEVKNNAVYFLGWQVQEDKFFVGDDGICFAFYDDVYFFSNLE